MSLIVDIEKDFGSFYLKANIKQEKGVLGFKMDYSHMELLQGSYFPA